MLSFVDEIKGGIPASLPAKKCPDPQYGHAPARNIELLTKEEKILAVRNALRYFDVAFHAELAPEFRDELKRYGRIYMYRFMPAHDMHARPIEEYPCKTPQAAAIMLMIQNNLDPKVAKYPQELITYGGNGAVFQNWAQYRLCMQYLAEMEEDQTLVMYSGHPMGLFPSHPDAPRVVVTNGMMIPNYSSKEDWNKYNALGVTQYGQMTAGSYMYIGPQGIVHGTTITLLNAGRMRGIYRNEGLPGSLFVTSGLGGMSGAQAIAAIIAGVVCIIGEIDPNAIQQRIVDGYVDEKNIYEDVDAIIDRALDAKENEEAVCLVYYGNIVELWERLAERKVSVELGSDQTSLHNIDDLGYCPIGFTFDAAADLLIQDKTAFMTEVRATLRRHVEAINTLSANGMYFWDYGNAFLKEAGEAHADIWKTPDHLKYKYPSYVEDIMGPLCFDYGFGPFRWVCTSGTINDLQNTDTIARECLTQQLSDAPDTIHPQLKDNIKWIRDAEDNLPIVGSKSRILYADAEGRIRIALAFNEAIADGRLEGPVVLGRDHHDVSGTDSPFRETANIYDGSAFTADMAIQNVIGDAFRGATWVSIHNGGGVGWGEVINGGFGMLLDGTAAAKRRLESMLFWDVNNGISRRAWARNPHAISTIKRAMQEVPSLKVTVPSICSDDLLKDLF